MVQVDVVRGPAHLAGGFLVVRGSNAGQLRLTMTGPTHPIETLSVDFFTMDQRIDPEKIDQLVEALIRSPRVHQFAADTIQARALAARREAERLAAERQAEEERERLARAAEAAAWDGASTAACASPTTLEACDGVRGYLAKYPDGWHSAEARDLLKSAEEPLKVIRDDMMWRKVDEANCGQPKSEDACESVTKYIEVYPEGRHASRAQELLKKAAPKLKIFRATREAREARDIPSDDGSAGNGGRFRGGGSVHVRGYTKKNGTYVRPHTRRR